MGGGGSAAEPEEGGAGGDEGVIWLKDTRDEFRNVITLGRSFD